MQIDRSYVRAATLIKRIVAPSNKVDENAPEPFLSDRTHSVYSTDVSIAPNAEINSAHDTFNTLYHTKDYLDRFKPEDYRIGAKNPLQADLNELIRLIVFNDIHLKHLDPNLASTKEVDKAITIAINHSGVSELEFYYFYLYAQKNIFPNEGWGRLAGNGGLAYGDPVLAETILDEVLKVQKRGYSYSGSFNQWTHSFKRSLGEDWLFERFIKSVNDSKRTGKPAPPACPFLYKKHSPSSSAYSKRGITINDFPGPGVVVFGIHSPVFFDSHLTNRFAHRNIPSNINEMINMDYRNALIDGAGRMSRTTYGFFRGVVVVSNHELMKVNDTSYSLVIFNDHFPSESHLETAYLVDSRVVTHFLQTPFESVGLSNILNPENLGEKGSLKDKVIKLFSVAGTAGFCEEAPGYDKSTWDVKHRLSTHKQITKAAFNGFTQLDLIREAYRLHLLGYYYNRTKNNFYKDEYVLLRELLRINKKMTQGEGETPPMPVAFPFTFMDHAINENIVREVGFVDADMVVYKESSRGDGLLFGDRLQRIKPNEIDNLSVEEIRALIGGSKERELWSDFTESCEYKAANPLIVDPLHKRIGQEIIKQEV